MQFDLAGIGAGLPFLGAVPDLQTALARDGRAVVEAPPGTGKTTLVPPVVANLGVGGGRVVVTQPRRMAARAAAARLAHLAGTRLGDEVGFTVRGESRVGPRTQIEFCTTGVLLRRLIRDPELADVAAIVVDEVHERHLDSDLVLAFARDLADLRDDLALVAMSATLDADRFAAAVGDADRPAPIVGTPALVHPLTVRWAPPATPVQDQRGVTPTFLDHVARVTADAASASDRSALVFLPGVREVERVAERLRQLTDRPVLPLHGRLPPSQQELALADNGPGRIVVSTAVAESSLTVPGVGLVVDAGLSREPRTDATRDLTGLVTVAVSRASAEQRAGRAARLGPGTVVRCYAEEGWSRLAPRSRPEITIADLTGALLDLACWGAPRGAGLALLDPLPDEAADRGEARLRDLGALDADGRPTPRGRAMAAIPADPRLARALLDAAPVVGSARAAEAVALLALDERAPGGDLAALLADLRRGGAPAAARWRDEVHRLSKHVAGDHAAPKTTPSTALGLVTAFAYPDRLARRRPGTHAYLLASGTGAELSRNSALQESEWLAVAEVTRGHGASGAVIHAAIPIMESTALDAGRTMITEAEEARWAGVRVTARRVRRLGAIELASTPITPSPLAGRSAVADALRREGLALLHWSDAASDLRRRLALVRAHLGDPWPAMDDTALLERAEEWLAPELDRLAAGEPARGLDLTPALRRLLPWPEAGQLDELAPAALTVPTGSRVRLAYPDPDDPDGQVVLAVKLQECFGLTETPRIVSGRVPIVFHLLSPARRPLAVTADLASFWANAYAGVRAENRGRYSKHPWPENPLEAPPQRGTRASGR